ncbi:MAG: response regulator, partial [Bacteroidota bacterium]
IVDDDQFMRELLSSKLTEQGFEVTAVGEGILALQTIRDHKPDLVLLDILLPGLSGLETLNVLRADEEGPHLPIILISNLNEPELIRAAERLGADDYIVKPFSAELLIQKIKGIKGF